MKPSEELERCLNFLRTAESLLTQAESGQQEAEAETQDILHALESGNPTLSRGWRRWAGWPSPAGPETGPRYRRPADAGGGVGPYQRGTVRSLRAAGELRKTEKSIRTGSITENGCAEGGTAVNGSSQRNASGRDLPGPDLPGEGTRDPHCGTGMPGCGGIGGKSTVHGPNGSDALGPHAETADRREKK